MIIILFSISLLLFIAVGVPIALSIVATGIVLMLYGGNFDLNIIGSNLINSIDKYVLLAIPAFIFTGELMNAGGLSSRIVKLSMAIVGHVRGGLGYVVILVSVILASLSGSAVADAAALAAILLPMMRASGYSEGRSVGLVAAGGIIGPVIPPSINLILFGVIAHVSITKLFMGGIIPGIFMGFGLVIVWWKMSREFDAGEPHSLHDIFRELRRSLWALFLPLIIVGGLRLGYFTPTETGVIAACYSLAIGLFIYRELSWPKLYDALLSAAKTSAVVILIVSCSSVLAWVITTAGLAEDVQNLFSGFADSKMAVMATSVAITIAFGMILDSVPLILILVPILFPVVRGSGIDPVYFGVVFVMSISIGLITPPVGNVLNVVSGVANIPFEKVAKGVLPFVFIEIFIIALFVLFPQLLLYPLSWLT